MIDADSYICRQLTIDPLVAKVATAAPILQSVTKVSVGYCVLNRAVGGDTRLTGTITLRQLLWKWSACPLWRKRPCRSRYNVSGSITSASSLSRFLPQMSSYKREIFPVTISALHWTRSSPIHAERHTSPGHGGSTLSLSWLLINPDSYSMCADNVNDPQQTGWSNRTGPSLSP